MTLYKVKVAMFIKPFYVIAFDQTDAVMVLKEQWRKHWAEFTYADSVETIASDSITTELPFLAVRSDAK